MKLGITFLLLVGLSGAQSTGNLPVYTGSGSTLTPVTTEIHSSAFTTPTLQTLINACPTTPTVQPCKVVLDPSTSVIKIPATTVIGTSTQWVTVENRGVTLECTGSSGACIAIGQWGALICTNKGPISTTMGGCAVIASSSFSGTALVTNSVQGGATPQSDFTLIGHNISAAAAPKGAVTEAPLWIVAVEGKGIVRDSSVQCVSGGYGLLLEDGSSSMPGDNNALVFENDQFFAGGGSSPTPCFAPIAIEGGSGGQGSNILFVGGSSVDSAGATGGCVSGNGCLVYIDGSANGGTGVLSNITFENFYLETPGSVTSTAMNFIEVKNARGIELNNVEFNGATVISKCLTISETAQGDAGYIHLTGRVHGLICTGVDNTITGNGIATNTLGNSDLAYIYPGDTPPGTGRVPGSVFIDGPLRVAAAPASTTLPTCVNGAILSFSNSTTNAWGNPISLTSSGGVPALGYCDGTAWTVIGK